MEMEEISCETKAKFRLNWKDLDKHYDDNAEFQLEKLVKLEKYSCSVIAKSNRAVFFVRCFGVKNLKSEVDLEVILSDSTKIKIVESRNAISIGDEFFLVSPDPAPIAWPMSVLCHHDIRMSKESRIQTITGIVTLTFEPEDGLALKDELISSLGRSVLKPWQVNEPEKPTDIKIECQGEKIEFHKFLLSKISDVFQNMIENPNFIESHNGVITMKEVSPNTIKAFKNLLYDNRIEETDLDVNLLIFCDRYNVKPLVDFCSKRLQESVTKENLMEIVDAAYKINDVYLLKKAVEFVRLHYGTFEVEEMEQWTDFMKSNPKCVMKMMALMMFIK